ncbi:MAG: helix-turn-helix domain-containing protein [Bacteroidales bacterium]
MEESLRNIISSLREKIEGKGLSIETVRNKGYRLEHV